MDHAETSLQDSALDLLLSNQVVETIVFDDDSSQSSTNLTYAFPPPCSCAKTVQESTSTLLAARAYSKAGHSDYAWEALDSLFAVQAENGFLPKYRYSPSPRASSNSTPPNEDYYVNQTTIPNWIIFGDLSNERYSPANASVAYKAGLHKSGRVSAIPFHATIVLDIFSQSPQTNQDLIKLEQNFDRIYRYHWFLHEVVMRGCDSDGSIPSGRDRSGEQVPPCYNVIHPWETLTEATSPLWTQALDTAILQMKNQSWTVDFDVPSQVTDAFDYPSDSNIYNASVYLLECAANATSDCQMDKHVADRLDGECEHHILSSCPFALLDVGYAAGLSKSDIDMLKIAMTLQTTNGRRKRKNLSTEISHLTKWVQQSKQVLKSLWDKDRSSFLSQSVTFHRGKNETLLPNKTEPLVFPVASNFLALWDTIEEKSMLEAMSFHMLQRQGRFSFNCGSFPLWSVGGCNADNVLDNNAMENNDDEPRVLYPLINYLVARGLDHNTEKGIAHFIANSTLNLVCGLPNTEEPQNISNICSASDVSFFHRAYDGLSDLPLDHNTCGATFTETAAVTYNLIVPDKPGHFVPAPPIRSSWVIVLVTVELAVAFTIGVSCLIVSICLLRRLKKSDNSIDNAFGRLMDQNESSALFAGDGSYFSAVDIIANERAGALSPNASTQEEESDNNRTFSGRSPLMPFRDTPSDS